MRLRLYAFATVALINISHWQLVYNADSTNKLLPGFSQLSEQCRKCVSNYTSTPSSVTGLTDLTVSGSVFGHTRHSDIIHKPCDSHLLAVHV
jgi:hypothetical protein